MQFNPEAGTELREAGSGGAAVLVAEAAPAAPPHAVAASPDYLPALDGLRFIAFLLVFCHHCFPNQAMPIVSTISAYGWFGVELFFAISAFLILRLLITEDERRGSINIGWFYSRRLLRIYPLMLFYPVLALVYYGVYRPDAFAQLLSLALGINNFVAWFKGYGTPIPHTAHLWTLSYELQAYAFIPLAFYILRKFGRNRLLAVLVAVEGFCLLARGVFVVLGAPHPIIWVTPFLRPESTLLGLALGAGLIVVPRAVALGIGVAAAVILVNGPSVEQIGAWTIVLYPLCAVIGGALVYLVARPGILAGLLARPVVAYLGKISFGLYVYHLPIVSYARTLFTTKLDLGSPTVAYAAQFSAALLATIAVASVSYFVVERPFLRLKQRVTIIPNRPV